MVEVKTLKCDRCDSIFVRETSEDELRIVPLSDIERLKTSKTMDATTAYVVFKYTKTGLGLCGKCYQELEQWLKSYKELSTSC